MATIVDKPPCPNCGNNDSSTIAWLWHDRFKRAVGAFSPDFHCTKCDFLWQINRVTRAERMRDMQEALAELRATTDYSTTAYR